MRRFIECLTTNTNCNLKCGYCYLIQQSRRTNKNAVFNYSPEYIGKSLSKHRLGGESLISITASGETLIPKELPYIAKEILKQGHFLNITTNGTLSQQIDNLLAITDGYHSHIHISFSFHYVELRQKNLIDVFFNNIQKVWKSGCSILLQINLVDEYIPFWEEIKQLSLKYVGALPQVALTRREENENFTIFSSKSIDDYIKIGKEMNSPLFDFTCRNFNEKRKEYCHAGLWSGVLNMETGELRGCYNQGFCYNIYKSIEEPIPFTPIGKKCELKYCVNSSHFMSQGIIPSLLPLPSYGELRNREEAHWYHQEMKNFLYTQFQDVNPPYSKFNKLIDSLNDVRILLLEKIPYVGLLRELKYKLMG